MSADRFAVLTRSSESPGEQETRKLLISAGTVYGMLFGLGFALFTWGYDGLLLASNAADAAWTKLLLGLPLTIIIGSLAGRIAASTSLTSVSVILWAAVGWLFGIIAGHIPFDGGNFAAWLSDRRLWGAPILAYGHAVTVRVTLVVLINIAIGAIAGAVEGTATQWAWDRATPEGKMSWGSLAMLLVSIPVALFMAMPADGFINRPLRAPQREVGQVIHLAVTGAPVPEIWASSYRSIEPFRASLSEQYVTYFVGFSSYTETWYSAYVDAVFDNGLTLRCVTVGKQVVYCQDLSQKLDGWMDDLVRAGLYDERPWLDEQTQHLAVDDIVLAWLTDHAAQLSETYEVSRAGQQGGWLFMSARFDTGFEMVCRFRGTSPVVVDQCVETSTGSPLD